jgi:hypothetical protein
VSEVAVSEVAVSAEVAVSGLQSCLSPRLFHTESGPVNALARGATNRVAPMIENHAEVRNFASLTPRPLVETSFHLMGLQIQTVVDEEVRY